ncbi:hypothetical protein [Thaumasiovibrio subtropicus]|uniref:hypothetical protein n=1 Tax=Thaumasiovibrio subtropicus TaxID=1891207 RepID=UPI001C84943A|nr:hypothetical protein [Thaumasiovibrio subtropicus]
MSEVKEVVSKKLKQLEEAKAIFTWDVMPMPTKQDHRRFWIGTLFISIGMLIFLFLAAIILYIQDDTVYETVWIVMFLIAWGAAYSLFIYMVYVDAIVYSYYKFELTLHGIRGIERSSVPVFWHHLGKVIVWGGMVACIVILL